MRQTAVLAFAVTMCAGIPAARAQEPGATTTAPPPPAPFEVHEIGYLDLNHAQDMKGWLRTIPETTRLAIRTVTQASRGLRTDLSRNRPNDPALLFHADRRVVVDVRVGFTRGAPVAWWPAGELAGDQLVFPNVIVDPKIQAPKASWLDVRKYPGLIPLRQIREAGATPVMVQGHREAGLVYEGVLPFAPAIQVRVVADAAIEVRNGSAQTLHDVIVVPAALADRGYLVGDLAPGETAIAAKPGEEAQPLADLFDLRLRSTGLHEGEVKALRQTVLAPDFRGGKGVRLLARIPRATWDATFPLQITPAPRQLVRVGLLRVFDALTYRGTPEPVPQPTVTRPVGPAPAPEPQPTIVVEAGQTEAARVEARRAGAREASGGVARVRGELAETR